MSTWQLKETGLASIQSPIGDGTRAFYQTHIPLHYLGLFYQADNSVATLATNILGRRTFTIDVQLAPAAATPSVQLAGSFDGATWTAIGAAIVAAGTTTVTATHYYPYMHLTTSGLGAAEGLQITIVVLQG